MLFVLLTVICYTISSQGDKYISSRLQCTPEEFALVVSAGTAGWLLLITPFTGWSFKVTWGTMLGLALLTIWKLLEFYTSALVLKMVSAYELKAWLGINVVVSYGINVHRGNDSLNWLVILASITLIGGIVLIIGEREVGQIRKVGVLGILFIFSKMMYGLQIGKMTNQCSSSSILFLVMLLVALLQLPRVRVTELVHKKGMVTALGTRLPNALGLLTEAMAATQNVFLYAMVQPAQLLLLFVVSLVKKEEMSNRKLAGSLICILAVCAITLLVRVGL